MDCNGGEGSGLVLEEFILLSLISVVLVSGEFGGLMVLDSVQTQEE